MFVRKLRLQRGWTQDQLSEISDLSIRTIQRLERGAKPSLETAKSLAAIFEVDFQSFQPLESEMNIENQETVMPESEKQAIRYGKSVVEYLQGIAVFLIVAAVAVWNVGLNDKVLWVLGALGVAFVVHGLMVFEIIRLRTVDLERIFAERKLGRKL